MAKGDPILSVRVNGRTYGLERTSVDYETVVSLADKTGTPSVTVRYPDVDGMPRDRTLSPGETCEVRAGMVFNVQHTGSA